MRPEIAEESAAALPEYGRVSIAFEVSRVFEIAEREAADESGFVYLLMPIRLNV